MGRNFLFNPGLFGLVILCAQCSVAHRGPDKPIRLTALNSMQRALIGHDFEGSPVVDIKAAKNEYEAFQVVISSGKKNHLRNVRVSISDLEGDSGQISQSHIRLFRAENVKLWHSSPRAEFGPGLFPDPLLPFLNPVSGDSIEPYQRIESPSGRHYAGAKYSACPIHLYPGQFCSIWIDVYIPPDAKAGIYKGNFRVTAGGNISSEIPILLRVWNFTLPRVASHRTHFGHFSLIAKAWGIDPDSERFREIEMEFCRELARHRVNPPIPHSLLPVVNEDGSLTIDPERHENLRQYIEETNLADFEVPRAPFMTNTSNSPLPTPDNQSDPVAIEKSKRYYREIYRYIEENGWEKRAYLYLIDEPNSVKDYNQVIALARVADEAAPNLKRLVVEQTYKHQPDWPDLDASINIWCPLFGFIDRKTIREKIQNGDEVWSYTALVQPAPSYHPEYKQLKDKDPPYWHIDQPVMMYRIPLWINRQYDITGLLYWTTAGWYNDEGPWLAPGMEHFDRINDTVALATYFNGGGMLFYPGKDAGFDGPVTSIRLKNIREGLEDYEYFAILDSMGEGVFVREMVDAVCPEWWDFTKDPETLLRVREQLAMRIESLVNQ